MVIYVDDILLASKSIKELDKVKLSLKQEFEMTDMGPVKNILGINIKRDRHTGAITLSQEKYIEELIKKFNMQEAKGVSTPIESNTKISKEMSPQNDEERRDMQKRPTETDISDHPYQLSLQTTSHICGASIISSKWAITAGHCVGSAPSRYTLRSGNSNNNLGNAYTIKNITRHPNYNSRTVDYDVALLEVRGTTFTLIEGGSVSPRLMRVTVPIVSRQQCNDAYKHMNTITDRMICAGVTAGGKDSCQGDSGGPLASNGFLYGIVSWGYGCAKPKYPGVYSNVANLRSWIKETSGI
ncbi:trypsin-1-like [Ceratina calcarata]|uniref:Trypsin-1-like n=1 Tax=Ceratina calcarata TaxID=156304 RepID=A0AAJ7SAN6_9HYME|nr:trypsin-1-like [Ceratina calcarata]